MTAQSLSQRMKLWFATDERAEVQQDRDETIRARFGGLVERAIDGQLASWADSPRRCLSLIILLDQFPRNIFRGTARAFAYDEQALGSRYRPCSRPPTVHSTSLNGSSSTCRCSTAKCARCRTSRSQRIAGFSSRAPQELRGAFEDSLKAAEEHRSIIERFGRFPHRNKVLARVNSPAEEEWLRNGGGAGMGQ